MFRAVARYENPEIVLGEDNMPPPRLRKAWTGPWQGLKIRKGTQYWVGIRCPRPPRLRQAWMLVPVSSVLKQVALKYKLMDFFTVFRHTQEGLSKLGAQFLADHLTLKTCDDPDGLTLKGQNKSLYILWVQFYFRRKQVLLDW